MCIEFEAMQLRNGFIKKNFILTYIVSYLSSSEMYFNRGKQSRHNILNHFFREVLFLCMQKCGYSGARGCLRVIKLEPIDSERFSLPVGLCLES